MITIRRANETDVLDVWYWWNDPLTRAMMAKKEYVSLKSHLDWFYKLINDKNRIMYIGIYDEEKFGVIRIDVTEKNYNMWEVSINLNPKYRGKKLAAGFLKLCSEDFFKQKPKAKLFANVGVEENCPSQKTFLRAGFKQIPQQNYKYHYELADKNNNE